jgi:SAM-dependent methyltransferase
MREVLAREVPGAEVVAGSAERIPLDDASVDAVFVAEAFHWFDSATAVREIARVLRTGGTLLVCFNHWLSSIEPPIGAHAEAALEDRWSRLPAPGGPKVASGEWKTGFDGAPFTSLEEHAYRHEWRSDRHGVAAYYLSQSSVGGLSVDEREQLRGELLTALPDAEYRLALESHAFRAVRT